MPNNRNYYITTTLPYVNADPHIGFALEIIQADTLARYKRQMGFDVCFNFGTDEHGLKIYRKAVESNKDPLRYCDEYALKFKDLIKALNLNNTNFVRTTDTYHIEAAQEFWKRCDKNGDIYKKNYRTKYCVGCELEKTDSELEKGRCPIHPNQELEIIEEENYFFRFSKYQKPLLQFYAEHSEFVVPEKRFSEIKNFVSGGLEDFSISRLKRKMPWGIDVPGNNDHVMFVWFDALINYVSTIGWPKSEARFNKWWPVVQIAGKDNLRQQSAIWQAMLMSATLPNSKQIFIHGFITSEGQKMSKTLGNVVNPYELVTKYGTDALRYYLLREIPSYDDGDYSERRFKEVYNADLANGLGNLVARVAKLCEKSSYKNINKNLTFKKIVKETNQGLLTNDYYVKRFEEYQFNLILDAIKLELITGLDQFINEKEPWNKTNEALSQILDYAVDQIFRIAVLLKPFLPETAEKILKQFSQPKIISQPPLFPRLA